MCGRMTCWPDGLQAVNQEAPSPLISFFPIEATPVPMSLPREGNHILKKGSSGGNDHFLYLQLLAVNLQFLKCRSGKCENGGNKDDTNQ